MSIDGYEKVSMPLDVRAAVLLAPALVPAVCLASGFLLWKLCRAVAAPSRAGKQAV